ncbi:MAG: NADH:ubiquinone reductase (Na(+)-transporting) subunit B [Bacteroidales bacterium]|jgi:Na+-transporting NADH:ubiquinone oxidoreductase subunit B|nr:NADH:ubiquinone reductase (Na(+)-transporting) subunit B [Bacteroidales bacterium]
MSWLENASNKMNQWFEKGKPFHAFQALFDAIDTFLLTPNTITHEGSHIRDAVDMKRVMMTVIVALMPPLLFGLWNVGYQHYLSLGATVSFWQQFWYGFVKWLPLVLTVYISGLAVEIIFAQKRGHQVAEGFFVTGMLIPMIMPPDIPLWIVAVATIFAVIFGKEVFGGNGYNFLNPALLARVFVFFAYPSVISGDKVWIAEKADAYSGATPLANASAGLTDQLPSLFDLFAGTIPGCIGETSKIAILLGAALLIFTGTASWRIMLSMTVGAFVTALLFNIFGHSAYMQVPAHEQLLMGGLLFATVYMATDPVTAPHTRKGHVIFGLLAGGLTILIRQINPGYVEGAMLAVILMNIFAPLIDWCVIQQNIRKRQKRISAR